MDNKKFGEFITMLRKEKGYTQKTVAEKLHVSDKAISRWENGYNSPDISILSEIAKLYDVKVDEILNGERNKSSSNENKLNLETAEDNNKKTIILIQNIIVILLAVISYLVVFAGNFIFNSVIIPLIIASGIIISGIICQTVFLVIHLSNKNNKYKYIKNAMNIYTILLVTVGLFSSSLVLYLKEQINFSNNSNNTLVYFLFKTFSLDYFIVNIYEWFVYGFICGAVIYVICILLRIIIKPIIKKLFKF